MNWNLLPDILVFSLICVAFASILRGQSDAKPMRWLGAWILIVIHFIFQFFSTLPGNAGNTFSALAELALDWAAIFFVWEVIPFKQLMNSRLMTAVLLSVYLLFTIVSNLNNIPYWAYDLSASLFGLAPLAVMLIFWGQVKSPIRIIYVGFYCLLSYTLLYFHHHPDSTSLFSQAPVPLFTYLACSVLFTMTAKKLSAGSLLTIIGMYLWAAVFLVAPYLILYHAEIHIEYEIWNLPKYIVACGMLLYLLEAQVEFSHKLAMFDVLSGLPNRRLFEDRLSSAIERANRSKTQMALLIVDLNNFKMINDTYGHAAGDEVLRCVSRRFAAQVRRIDTVARTGGDEFAVILEGPVTRVDAERIGKKMIHELIAPFYYGGASIQIQSSLGVALYPDDAEDMIGLYTLADNRMYINKNNSSANLAKTLYPEGLTQTRN